MKRVVCRLAALIALTGCGDGAGTPDTGAATDAVASPPACGATVGQLVEASVAGAPAAGSDGYLPPDLARRAALAASVASADDPPVAMLRAAEAGYRLCAAADDLLVWRSDEPTAGDALVVYRRAGARGIVLEAPHPIFDSDTATEAASIFEQLSARALLVSGTHRCANAGDPSGCDGSTSACGTSAPYPSSDMAHAVDSFFHAAHVAIATRHDADWIVSVHGMAGDGVHISDGTTLATDAGAPVARTAAALASALPGEPILSCNDFPGAATTTELCGTTNVQGRAVNGSANACTDAAAQSAQRFLHLEQSRSVRDQGQQVSAALDSVVPPAN